MKGAVGVGVCGGVLYAYTLSHEGEHDAFFSLVDNVGMRLLRLFDPETAHEMAVWALRKGLCPKRVMQHRDEREAEIERVRLWDLEFPNPIGLAAGFDKNAEGVEGLLNLGFGFVEVGSVTPRPQEGNPKPRMFRLPEDEAVINRYGFNSKGVSEAQRNLKEYWSKRSTGTKPTGLVGVNIGKNKTTEKAEEDYCVGVEWLTEVSHYLVINVSSPNTPGLRSLQRKDVMKELIQAVQKKLSERTTNCEGRRVPLLVKVAPDLTPEERKDIAAVALETKIDGLVVSNTTIARPDSLQGVHKGEAGGLSGRPLKEMSTQIIHELYSLTGGKVPIIGVGGVGSGADAYEKIKAGASLVQLYSMLVYTGPGCVLRIRRELLELLERDGFKSVQDAVGSAHGLQANR